MTLARRRVDCAPRMTTSYKDIVSQLRTAFPAPVSDRLHDAYFVFSFLRALDQVDALKSAAPMLGDAGHAGLRRGATPPDGRRPQHARRR